MPDHAQATKGGPEEALDLPARAASPESPGADAGAIPGAGLLGAIVGPAGARRRFLPGPRGVLSLQRRAGNAATTKLLTSRRAGLRSGPPTARLQRVTDEALGAKATNPDEDFWTEFDKKKSDADKLAHLQAHLGSVKASTVEEAWSKLSDELGAAKGNPDLFAKSVKIDDDILDHDCFEEMRETFKKDVEAVAVANLHANRELVVGEMERTGVAAEQRGEETSTEHDTGVQDVQKLVPQMEKIKSAKAKMLATVVGVDYGSIDRGTGEPMEKRQTFDPSDKPEGTLEGAPTWDTVNAEWRRVLMTEAALIRKAPSAAYFLGTSGEGDIGKLKDASDIKGARAAIATALTDLAAKIDKAVPLIGDDITYIDMPPVQQQLLSGMPSASGTNWSKPVEKAVAGEEIADATISHLLVTLGLATVSAAFFILATIATGGGAAALAPYLFAAGFLASGTNAAMSWNKWNDLATANKATVDPELALVTGEQVDDAFIGAILDTVFVAIDGWQAVTGGLKAIKTAKAAKGLLEAGKAGAAGTARAALQTLGKAGVNEGEVIAKAVGELGPDEVRKLTGLSFEDMAKKVGGEGSEMGKRLLELGSKGVSEETKALLEKLPKILELEAAEGDKVLKAAIDRYGVIGALDKVGGWAAIKKSPVMKAGQGSAAALEAWRKGLVTELEEYIAKESQGASQAVRSGTEKASSDLDVQIVQGTAAELQEKAEAWLASRTGRDVEGAKKLLDAEIFVDPFRSHFYDIVKGLDDAARKQIAEKMGDYERRMIAGAEIRKAGGAGTEAGDKAIKEWADKGVKEPFLDFEPLSPGEQKKAAGMIDGWMEQLKNAKTVEDKAPLVEKISKAQAQINASHPDAYVGGGVRAWVTGREDALEDVKKLAEAVNMTPEELLKVSKAQRIMASLNEAKWLEAALGRLRKATIGEAHDVGKVAKDVTDIGKHGARGAGQLSKAGAPNADALTGLFVQLEYYKTLPSDEIAKAIAEGRLVQIEGEVSALLQQLKRATKTAVDGLGTEMKTFASTADDMAKFQALLIWQTRYAELVDDAIMKTSQFMKLYASYLQELTQTSIQTPEPDKSYGPPAEPAATGSPAAGTPAATPASG
jgi:hypothetical protein